MEYAIDPDQGTVRQVWDYGEERGPETFSPIVSDVDHGADGGHVFFATGAVEFGGSTYGKVVELDPSGERVLFEATVTPPRPIFIITFHRAERLPPYPGDGRGTRARRRPAGRPPEARARAAAPCCRRSDSPNRRRAMTRVRVHNFAMSLDGYVAGPDQSRDAPLGVGGTRLHEWAFATRSFRRAPGMEGGEEGTDDDWMEAAGGEDVRIGGGASTVRQYLRAGLIDELHVAVVPVLLGDGERLFDDVGAGLPDRYECLDFVGSDAVAHVRIVRRAGAGDG